MSKNIWKVKYETIHQAFVNLAHGNHDAYERRRDLEKINAGYLSLHEEQRGIIAKLGAELESAKAEIKFLKKVNKRKKK